MRSFTRKPATRLSGVLSGEEITEGFALARIN
jgi:hypothetical protein